MLVKKHCMQNPQAIFKTIGSQEAFDFNKSTQDSHAVFDIQVGLFPEMFQALKDFREKFPAHLDADDFSISI
mgnify:CR=1 FL=1